MRKLVNVCQMTEPRQLPAIAKRIMAYCTQHHLLHSMGIE